MVAVPTLKVAEKLVPATPEANPPRLKDEYPAPPLPVVKLVRGPYQSILALVAIVLPVFASP